MTSSKDNQDWLDEIIGVPNEMMTSWEIERLVKAKAAITAKIAEARIEELEWLLDPTHAHISIRERLKALKGKNG